MEMQEALFTSGNRSLVGHVFGRTRPGSIGRGVLFVHGQGSSQRGYEKRAIVVSRSLNAVCFTFDLSGHGADAANFDRYSVYDHLQDIIAAYDYLTSTDDVNSARIGICGASYGAYLAALATASRPVKRLVLRAPSLARDVDFPNLCDRRSAPREVAEQFDSLRILGKYTGEVLVVESEKDEIIPKSQITKYLAACPRVQHQLIPEATHALTNPAWDEVFIAAIENWFKYL
jgi:pimeloyl-ACP methyl ester carboxylesterase